jgi:hypothetical protein
MRTHLLALALHLRNGRPAPIDPVRVFEPVWPEKHWPFCSKGVGPIIDCPVCWTMYTNLYPPPAGG